MTVHQFLAAVQELAVRLYAKVIEQKTGTVLECLPTQQRERAIRAAMDVFVLKKIVPTADQLGLIPPPLLLHSFIGLIPWELMVLDQCLTTIHSSDVVEAALVNHIHIFLSWYAHYARGIQLTPINSSPAVGGEEKGSWGAPPGVRDLRSPAGLTSSPYRGDSGYGATNPSPHRHLPVHLQSSSYSSPLPPKLSGYSITASSPSPRLAPSSPSHLFKGISYKEISKFYHDYGIVPYLLKEPQLFK